MDSRYKNIVQATRDAIICADNQGCIVYVNPAATRLFNYREGELIGADLTVLMPPRFRPAHQTALERFFKTGRKKIIGKTVELAGLDKSGVEFPLELSLSAYDAAGRVETIGVIRDITVRKGLLARLEQQASTDYLTGLWNRLAFDEKLADEWRRARRYKKPLALLLADLDHFKEYNDLYGHQAGDAALKLIADIMRKTVRTTDLVARYGGEEIAAVLPETDNDSAIALAQRVLLAVRNLAIEHAGLPSKGLLTISLGVGALAETDNAESDLLRKADLALYQAKNSGRNRFMADFSAEDGMVS